MAILTHYGVARTLWLYLLGLCLLWLYLLWQREATVAKVSVLTEAMLTSSHQHRGGAGVGGGIGGAVACRDTVLGLSVGLR